MSEMATAAYNVPSLPPRAHAIKRKVCGPASYSYHLIKLNVILAEHYVLPFCMLCVQAKCRSLCLLTFVT